MNLEDLKKIEDRLTRTTTAPWYWEEGYGTFRLYTPKNGHCTVMDFTRFGTRSAQPRFSDRAGQPLGGIMINAKDLDLDTHPDAQFIAHAREDVPALIAEIKRLRAQVEDLEDRLVESGQFSRWER